VETRHYKLRQTDRQTDSVGQNEVMMSRRQSRENSVKATNSAAGPPL